MIVAGIGFGLLVGALLGLVGGGGSILAVPALVYGVGMPLAAAIPSSLVVVGASSVAAVIPRLGKDIHWPVALTVGAAGGVVAFVGAAVNRLLPQELLLVLFAVIMVIAGIRMLWAARSGDGLGPDSADIVTWPWYLFRAIATGMVVGFLTGLLGVGGGFLIVPALVLMLGLPMTMAVGTSLVIVAINSAFAFVSQTGHLEVDWGLTSGFAVAAMGASYVAGRLGRRLPEKMLKTGFAALVLLVAAYVLVMAAL